jgi:hypothetical protein
MACENCSCGKAQIEKAQTVDKIEIRQRDPNKLMTGANTIVLMNGQPVRHTQSIEVKVDARGLGIVKLEMYASVKMNESIIKDVEIKNVEIESAKED